MCGIPGSTDPVSDGVNLSSPSDLASVEARLIGYSTKTPRYNHSIRPRVGGWATLGCPSRLHRHWVGSGQGETRISCCSSPVCGPPTRGRWSREVREFILKSTPFRTGPVESFHTRARPARTLSVERFFARFRMKTVILLTGSSKAGEPEM